RSPSSKIGFKKPIDMLGLFSWLASIKQEMLEPVRVKCIFLGYHKSIVDNKLWKFDDVTSKFEVELLGDHTFKVEPQENVDQGAGLQEVQTKDLMDYQLALAAVENIYAHESLTFNNTVACEATKGLMDKAKVNVLGMEIVRDQSGNTMRVSQSRFYNKKLVQTLLEGHSILSLEGRLSGDCDVEKNGKWSCIYAVGSQEYQMVCTRLDIASADVGKLDKFDRRLQTDVHVFVDFDYAMG
ncbi:hypothetical protein Tco_0865686, partial [Tanacetum coccineum]